MNALHIASLSLCCLVVILFHQSAAAPVPTNRVRILSLNTGLYVHLKAGGVAYANAGDLTADHSTHFFFAFTSDGGITLRNEQTENNYLTLYEDGESGIIAHPQDDQISSGSGDIPNTLEQATDTTSSIQHTSWVYGSEPSLGMFANVLSVQHSSGKKCYLAFEEDGTLVADPCNIPDTELYKAEVMLNAVN